MYTFFRVFLCFLLISSRWQIKIGLKLLQVESMPSAQVYSCPRCQLACCYTPLWLDCIPVDPGVLDCVSAVPA